jgi:hypothetical protein
MRSAFYAPQVPATSRDRPQARKYPASTGKEEKSEGAFASEGRKNKAID